MKRQFEAAVLSASAVAAAGGVCLGAMLHDNRRFIIRRYRISSPKIEKPLKLVFISDLHEKDYGSDNGSVEAAVRREKPDLILSGGDQIVSRPALHAGEDDYAWCEKSLSLFRRLSGIAPVMMAEGNHELRLHRKGNNSSKKYSRFLGLLEESGVRLLHNETAEFRGIKVCGLELPDTNYKRFRKHRLPEGTVGKYLGRPDPGTYNILLAHDPAHFEEYLRWGADLVLSGHLHGGMMRLPLVGGVVSPAPALFPRYSGGRYTADSGEMIVSCGLGMHTIPVRVFNPGELTVIELAPKGTIDGHIR